MKRGFYYEDVSYHTILYCVTIHEMSRKQIIINNILRAYLLTIFNSSFLISRTKKIEKHV